MGSKAFLILGLFVAIFVMISSEVVARELAETSTTSEDSKNFNNKNEVHVAHSGGYNGGGYSSSAGYHGGGHGGGGGYSGGGHGRYKFVETPAKKLFKKVAKEAAKDSAAHSVVAKEIRLRDLALIVLGSSLFVFI